MPIDRNRGSGRVPGSPWNLSIRPTRSPPPAYRLTASSLSSAFPFHCLEYCPFPYPCSFDSLPSFKSFSPLSPQISLQLLHHFSFFIFFYFRPLFLLRFSFSVFTPFSSYRSADLISHIFQGFFFLTDRHAADLPSGWLAKNRGDSKISFICLNPGIRSGNSSRENPAFFNKIPRKRRWNVRLCRWQMSSVLRTFFDGLMITEGLLDHTRESLLFFLPYFIDDFLIFA